MQLVEVAARQYLDPDEKLKRSVVEIPRMSYRYQSRLGDSALRERLVALAREKPR
jgi:hypothetical protein